MNTDTENNGKNKKLQGAFGDRGMNVNSMTFGHPYAEQIVSRAKEIICESPTGAILNKVIHTHGVKVHVMKGKMGAGTGFSPEMKTIFLSVPGNTDKAGGEVILNLIKAMREADHEYSGRKRPNPSEDLAEYAAFIHAQNLDALKSTCKVLGELEESSNLSILLDSLEKLGLNRFHKAYLDGKPDDILYDYYAEAYDTNRGSI